MEENDNEYMNVWRGHATYMNKWRSDDVSVSCTKGEEMIYDLPAIIYYTLRNDREMKKPMSENDNMKMKWCENGYMLFNRIV